MPVLATNCILQFVYLLCTNRSDKPVVCVLACVRTYVCVRVCVFLSLYALLKAKIYLATNKDVRSTPGGGVTFNTSVTVSSVYF